MSIYHHISIQWPMAHRVLIAYGIAVKFRFLACETSDVIYKTNVFLKEKSWGYLKNCNYFIILLYYALFQWPMDHRVYITYRLAVSIGFLAWVASDAIYETNAFFKEKPWSYLIYATNWSFLLLASTAMFMAITTLYYSVRSGECLG